MPELPEVETVRRDLRRRLLGARIVSVWTSGKPLHLNRPIERAALRAGRRIVDLRRHGKYLLIDTDRGLLVVHLGMTGQLVVGRRREIEPHTHVVWRLDTGLELRYTDARRFGRITTRIPEALGIDPLDRAFTPGRLAEELARSGRAMKTFLLDQSRVAGIGNIYASEALFVARIHPDARADRLEERAVRALWRAILSVLRGSIRHRGTTLRDYADGEGRSGRNQRRLQVYGREGKPCRRCGALILRKVDQGRATYFCPTCQTPRVSGISK